MGKFFASTQMARTTKTRGTGPISSIVEGASGAVKRFLNVHGELWTEDLDESADSKFP